MSPARISESSVSTSALLFGGIVLLLVFAKEVLVPLAFALTLSFTLVPAVALLERRRVPRNLAVAIVTLLTCACVAVGAYVVSRQVLNVAQTLPGYRANIHQKVESLHSSSAASLETAAVMMEDVSRDLALSPGSAGGDAVRVQVVGARSDQLESTAKLIGTVLEPFGQIGIVVIFTIYMLMNREDLRHRLLLLAGMGNINVMTQALEEASGRISQYLTMQFRVNACYGAMFGIGLYLCHVPDATLWGVIAGTLRIVPYVGTMFGMLLPLTLSFAVSSSWWSPLLVLGVFLVLETTVANFVEPWLFSSKTGISSLALLCSVIFWSMLWGLPGLVLSTPLTVCVVVLGRYVPQLSFLHSLLGTTAQLSPAARVYERLLAMDQTEAWAVAEGFLGGRPLAELYDAVLIPVLSLAEEDRHKGALSDVRWKFLLLSMTELVARLSEYQPAESPEREQISRWRYVPPMRSDLQKEFAVVCVVAGDRADELATAMLTQLLERAGYQTLTLAADAISEVLLRGLAAEKDTVVFVSALPPFAFAQSRAVCHRVRAEMPENRIAVALWNSREDAEEMLARFGTARPEAVVSTLAQSVRQVDAWQRATHKV